MIERAAVVAKLGIRAHAHMLRNATGFKLANDGIDTRALQAYRKRPTCHALADRRRAWEVCSVIGKLVSTHDDGYSFGQPRAAATVGDL